MLAKVCFDASFMCLSRFVAIYVLFDNLCCWTSHSVLLSRIHLRVTDQKWQTGPNEPASHFEVDLVVSWHQIGKLVQVVYITAWLIFPKLHKSSSKIRILNTLKQIIQLENIPCVYLHDNLKKLVAKVCFDASFLCLSRFVAFRFILNEVCCWRQRCGLLSRIQLKLTDQIWQTGPNETVLHFEVVLVVCWHEIGILVQVVYLTY